MDPIGDTGIDERHASPARRGPVVIDDHSRTRFSQRRLVSDSGNDGKYVGKSKDAQSRTGMLNHRDCPTTQTLSRGAQAGLKGKQRESPQPESEIEDFSDIDMLENYDRVKHDYGQLEQEKSNALSPSATVWTMTKCNYPAVVDRFCHSPPQAYDNSDCSNSSGKETGSHTTQGPLHTHSPMKHLPGVCPTHRGQREDVLAGNPIQRQGVSIFSIIKSVIMEFISPQEKAAELYNGFSSDYRNLLEEADHFKSENRILQATCNKLREEVQQYREGHDLLLNELQRVYRELEDSRHLADVRGWELQTAQEFLSTADILSVSEIAQKVIELNDEIYQASALLSESLDHEVANRTEDATNIASAFTHSILGGLMFDAITNSLSRRGQVNPILVQLSLQTYLASFCCEKLNKWYERDKNINQFLVNIYKEILRTEEQAVSGRWRAITHAKTRLETNNWAFEFTMGLKTILRAASIAPVNLDFLFAFEPKLDPIFKAIINLRIALGEQFTSADITPFVVTSGTPFEAKSMEDALSDVRSSGRGQRNTADIVISTVGIGLKECVSQLACKASNESENLILTPKVVLQSTLTDFLRHSPFPRSD